MPTTTPFNNLITFSRGSNATVTGPNGLIQWAPNNAISFSEQMDNAAWTKDNSTVYANQDVVNGTLGAELRGSGVIGLVGTATAATYNTGTGAGSVTRVDASNQSFVQWSGLSTFPYRVVITCTGGVGINIRSGTQASSFATTASPGAPVTVYVTPGSGQITLTSAGGTSTFTLTSIREVTPLAATAPDGTNTADTWVPTTSGTTATVRLLGTTSLPVGYIATASFYVKSAGKRWVYMTTPAASSSQHDCWFDLQTGTVGTQRPAVLSATITPVGNGWYRLTTTAVTVAVFNYIFLSAPDADASNVVTADGGGLLVWGAQLELGSTATTYNSTTVKNLLGFSEAFDNAAWVKTRASIVTGAAANPINGLFNAQKLMEDTTASNTHRVNSGTVTVATGSTVTVSVYVKAAGRTWCRIADGGVTASGAYVNLATGQFGTISAGVTRSSIVSIGDGWYRVSITGVLSGSLSQLFVDLATGDNVNTYTGDGNSGVYIYGAQLSDSASLDPYVPTPGAAPSSTAFYGPRFDFDPVTLQPRGLLVEEQRTNLATYSDQFNDASWVKNNVTVTANTVIAPDGTLSADTFTATGVTTDGVAKSFASSAVAYTFSTYLKQGNTAFSEIAIIDQGTVANRVRLTYATGVLTVVSGSPTGTATNVGNGWWRVTIAYTFPAIGAADTFHIYPGAAGGGAGDFTYVWGAQLETGAFATSYIPTLASTVTRSADVALISGQNFAQWYNQPEGTFVVEYRQGEGTTARAAAVANDGTNNNTIELYIDGSTDATALPFYGVYVGGVAQAALSFAAAAVNSNHKMAGAYRTNDFAASVDGSSVATDTSGTLPTPTRLSIGANGPATGSFANGHIRSINYVPARAADFQLQAITTQPIVDYFFLQTATGDQLVDGSGDYLYSLPIFG